MPAGPRTARSAIARGAAATTLSLAAVAALAAGPTSSTFTPSGPIRLSSGQTISGLHITNPNGPCISGYGVSNVRITNSKIGPCATSSQGVGIYLESSSNARIDHVLFDDVASAFYAMGGGSNFVFEQNVARRIRGPMPRGQMVQFNSVYGAGHRISCNVSDLTSPAYLAGPEDHISIYRSGGTSTSPIDISYNKIRGGGPSTNGGGILAGDGGSDHVVIRDNILVHPGSYGVAIAGGSNIKLLRNRVYANNVYPWSNIGAYVWAQAGVGCSGHEVQGNNIFARSSSGALNAFWNGGNCGSITGLANNTFTMSGGTTLSAAIFDETIPACVEGGVPSAPSNLTGALSRTTAPADVVLRWTDNATNESNMVVERAPVGGSFGTVATLAANTTTWTDPGRPAGGWIYRVKAQGAGGASGYSNTVTMTIAGTTSAPPSTGTTGVLLPVADGLYKQWSGWSYTRVNEASCNGTASFANTSTVARRVSYGIDLSTVPVGATITGISITPCASRNLFGTDSAGISLFYRWNGANGPDGPAIALAGTTPVQLAPTQFTGLAIQRTSTSTLEVGATSWYGSLGARLSRMAVTITYQTP